MVRAKIRVKNGYIERWLEILTKIENEYPMSQMQMLGYGYILLTFMQDTIDETFFTTLGDYVSNYQLEGQKTVILHEWALDAARKEKRKNVKR